MFDAALTFNFVQTDSVREPRIWAVSVAGITSKTFPISALGMQDTVTAAPGKATGTYDSGNGWMNLTLPVVFTDSGGHIPNHAETIAFTLATNKSITAGMQEWMRRVSL